MSILSIEGLVAKGFALVDADGPFKRYEKKFGEGSSICFGGVFNGACEVHFPDGNDGKFIIGANLETMDDLDTIERLFAGCTIDSGTTITTA